MLYVRKAEPGELGDIMRINRAAQDFMARTGNPNQWKHTHPALSLVKSDIENGTARVICDGTDAGRICGVFAMCEGADPTYSYIEGGKWLDDVRPYVTIHRIAGDQTAHGILRCAAEHCRTRYSSVRADTHRENLIMQRALEKNGFSRCGTIYLQNGDPRMAYQWVSAE